MKQLLAFVFVTMFGVFSFAQSKEALGKECIHLLFEEGNYKKVHAMFNDDFKTKLTVAQLSQTGSALEVLGDYKGIDKDKKISGLVLSSEHREFKKKK